FFRMLCDRAVTMLPEQERGTAGDGAVAAALWDLVWSGRISNDTLAPLRTVRSSGRRWLPSQAASGIRAAGGSAVTNGSGMTNGSGVTGGLRGAGRPGRQGARRHGYGRPAMPSRTGPPTVSGRWSLVLPGETDPTRRRHAVARRPRDRHGILTGGAVATERVPGGFAALYPVLGAMEEAGQCRRGYFVEGLGAAQFALPGAVDRLRALAARAPVTDAGQSAAPSRGQHPPTVVVLAAADPANAYGGALPWPPRPV